MKRILLLLFSLYTISLTAQITDNQYFFSYNKDGVMVTDTFTVKNTEFKNLLDSLIKNPNFKQKTVDNDTIFDSSKNPVIVFLGDAFFGASIQKLEYDSLNRLKKVTGFDTNNNIKPFYHYVAIIEYNYDEHNNLIEQRQYGEDGKLISSEFEDVPITLYKYNNRNQKIEERYLNEYRKPMGEYYIYKYSYNNSGKIILIGAFNDSGEKKKN